MCDFFPSVFFLFLITYVFSVFMGSILSIFACCLLYIYIYIYNMLVHLIIYCIHLIDSFKLLIFLKLALIRIFGS